jgi:hypothetical protein
VSDYSPADLGDAIHEALVAGENPFTIKSGWIDVIFPTDCAGNRPEGDDGDHVRELTFDILFSCGVETGEIDQLLALYGIPKPATARVETYADLFDGPTRPRPPLADLREYSSHGSTMPVGERYGAAEDWWINADHPGFGADAEWTAGTMRQAGFTEPEIRSYLLDMVDKSENGPFPATGSPGDVALTDRLAQLVEAEMQSGGDTSCSCGGQVVDDASAARWRAACPCSRALAVARAEGKS